MNRSFARRLAKVAGVTAMVAVLVAAVPWFWNARTPAETDLARSAVLARPPAPPGTVCDLLVATAAWEGGGADVGEVPALMGRLASAQVDIAALQGLNSKRLEESAVSAARVAGYGHVARYPSGLLGSGLVVISRHAMLERQFHRFRSAMDWRGLWTREAYLGRGAALAWLELAPAGGCLGVATTALAPEETEQGATLRQAQGVELAAFLRRARVPGCPILVLGVGLGGADLPGTPLLDAGEVCAVAIPGEACRVEFIGQEPLPAAPEGTDRSPWRGLLVRVRLAPPGAAAAAPAVPEQEQPPAASEPASTQ